LSVYWFDRYSDLLRAIPQEGAARLELSLARTEVGFGEDLRTPFFNGKSRSEILNLLQDRIGFTSFQELTGIDETEKAKVGPMSIMLPYSERKPDVMKYWKQRFNADYEVLEKAAQKVSSLLPRRALSPASFDAAYDLMPRDTSLGLPWLTRDRRYASSYLDRARSLSSPEEIYPCVLYWRGQSAGLNEIPKQRVVWGFDHAETIFGATVLYPVLDALKRLNGFSAWLGDVFVDEAITRILRRSQGRRIISADYSGFDSSLHIELLNYVDLILGGWFDELGAARVQLLGQISNRVPLVVPFSILNGRTGGMPSGSVLTNLRDTIANLLAGWYVAYHEGVEIEDYEVLGDDSVFLFSDDLPPETFSDVVSDLGLESNPAKQFVSDTGVHFLQRWHSLEYSNNGLKRGVRSPFRAISGMLSYERWRRDWNKYLDSARWIMQVENTKNDPRFRTFVRFLFDGDRVLRSGIDPTTVFRKAGGADVIRSTLSIASFPFNVQNPEKIEAFETTQVLRSLG
jgi:hypothetical protein